MAGWSASVLGARAHGIILDDALTQEDSESALVTERAWAHLTMTVENRLHPGGWLLGVGTRWTADDLIGRARRAGWPVYRFPAIGPYPLGPPQHMITRLIMCPRAVLQRLLRGGRTTSATAALPLKRRQSPR